MHKTYGVLAMIAAVLLAGILPAAHAAETSGAEKVVTRKIDQLPDPVARVNGVVIPAADLKKSISAFMQSPAAAQVPAGQEMAVYKYLLNQMVNGELMYQAAQGTRVDDLEKQVDAELGKLKMRYKNETDLANDLRAQGLSLADLRLLLQRNIQINSYIEQEIVPKQLVSEAEVKEFFEKHPQNFSQSEQVRASHILIGVAKDADAAARKKAHAQAEAILAKVKAGGDFAVLAKETSSCPSGAQGGDLGAFGKGAMVKEFEDAAWTMKPGDISGIVETKFGYHIIKVTERIPAAKQSFDEVKVKLAENLKRDKIRQAVSQRLKEVQQKAKIELFLK